MTKLFSRKQTLIILSLISAAYIGLFLLTVFMAKMDTTRPSTGGGLPFTAWEMATVLMYPLIAVAPFVLIPLGIGLIVVADKRKPPLDFVFLSILIGVVCAIIVLFPR